MKPWPSMIPKAGRPRYPASAHRCLLRRVLGALRLTMMACRTASSCVTSCAFAPVTTSDNGTPRPSTSRWRLLPFFPPISRVAPDRPLRQWGLEHCPVNALPSPSDTLHLVVLGKPSLPQGLEHARSLPLQEALVHRTCTAKALLGQRFPLAASAQNVHDRLEHLSRRLGRAPRSCLTHIRLVRAALPHRHQRFDPAPELITHLPRFDPLACDHALAPHRVKYGSVR